MPYLKVGEENNHPIELFFEDRGNGRPVVLIHGYPLNGRSWERQAEALLNAGYRVVSYDRRGFGMSSHPSGGYDYTTFAADLEQLMRHLDLRDAALAGFSMGTGEVVRYLGRYGPERVSQAILIGAIPPYLPKTDDNPEGVEHTVFEQIGQSIRRDRYAYFTGFFKDFYNTDELLGVRVSEEVLRANWNVAARSGARASLECVTSWLTDFREDVAAVTVPTLLIHGDRDMILPIQNTAARLPQLIADLEYVVIEGGPHNVLWTFAEEVNAAMLGFLAR